MRAEEQGEKQKQVWMTAQGGRRGHIEDRRAAKQFAYRRLQVVRLRLVEAEVSHASQLRSISVFY